MKKVTAIYFSPTRGTKKYVEAVAKALDPDFTVIDLTSAKARAGKYHFGADDLVIFGAPVYAGRLPLYPEKLYGNITGDGTPAIFTVTYGNREFDDALLETKDMCEANGFVGIAAAAWLAEHTYSAKLAGGRPSQEDLAEVEDFAEKITQASLFEPLDVPGNRPYRDGSRHPMNTVAAERCSECGLCARICPVGAIHDGAGFEADQSKCIGCLACVKRCMRSARIVDDPGLAAIRQKLEPAFGGVYKANQYFLNTK